MAFPDRILPPVLLLLLLVPLIGLTDASPVVSTRIDALKTITEGYVAFGDSYAAGMGTGTTSPEKCRVASNNFAKLLNNQIDNPDVEFQPLYCSGDTTFGLNKQIDAWKNPEKADIATLSIGGNDLDFSSLVRFCIIHDNPLYTRSAHQGFCDEAKRKANNLLADPSGNGMTAKLYNAYKNIISKAKKDARLMM